MNTKKLAFPLLSACLLLASCNTTGQRLNVSLDAIKQSRSDSVVVEAGNSAPALAAAPAVAATAYKAYTVAKGDSLNAIAKRFNCSPAELAVANGITNRNALKAGAVLKIPGKVVQEPVPAPLPVADQLQAPIAPPVATQQQKSWWQFWRQQNPTVQQQQQKSWQFWRQQNPTVQQQQKSWWQFWRQQNPAVQQPQQQKSWWQFWRQQNPTVQQPQQKSWWQFWRQQNPAVQQPQQQKSWQFWRKQQNPVPQQVSLPAVAPAVAAPAPAVTPQVAQAVSYIVRSGDSLGAIARQHGTTVSALMSANGLNAAQANKLRIGQKITIPASARN